MKQKLKLVLFASILSSSIANAGFHEFTMHSRANCKGFNESISWHFLNPYYLMTYTRHSNPKAAWGCNFNSPMQQTWRSAAVHYAEGYGGWHVVGSHYYKDSVSGALRLLRITEADDCNIYDGWWDV